MARIDKQFDAVQTMRSIRDHISEEITCMAFDDRQACIRPRLRDAPIARDRDGSRDNSHEPVLPRSVTE